jgi:hypothetical protein
MKKIHGTNSVPTDAPASEAMRSALEHMRPFPDGKVTSVKLLLERVRSLKEHLGGLDFQKAQLEAQMQDARARLARESAELEQLVRAEAEAQGLGGGGWVFDFARLAFVRSAPA